MTGTPSRTARASAARRSLKEAEGKLLTRGTRTACEALPRGRGSVGVQSPMSSGTRWGICGGDGRKVTRLTLGALSICLVLGRPRGFFRWVGRSQQRAIRIVVAIRGPNM